MPNFSTNTGSLRWWLGIWSVLMGSVGVAQPIHKPMTAVIAQEGFSVGFSDTTKVGGKPFWFEASAILYDGKNVLVAHDKAAHDKKLSPVGSWNSTSDMFGQQPPTYFNAKLFQKGVKYEEFAQTPDKRWVFLTTAFDRVKEGSTDWDGYNMLLYWPAGRPEQVRVLGKPETDTVFTSVKLRDKISSTIALGDLDYYGVVRYFKIEGLTATSDRLILGVREEGNSYQDFKYIVRILSVPYQVVDRGAAQRIELTGSFSLLGTITLPDQTTDILPSKMGLSSIKFDPTRNCFWLLTSYESETSVGSYLWCATEAELAAGQLHIVRTPDRQPLRLAHKAEDMTFLNPKSLLLIHDDDRIATQVAGIPREPNQAAYTVLMIN